MKHPSNAAEKAQKGLQSRIAQVQSVAFGILIAKFAP